MNAQESERTPKLLTAEDLAPHLSLTPAGVRWLRRAKRIPYRQIGYRTVRYSLPDVLRALEKRKVN
jgi:hypothetical protein